MGEIDTTQEWHRLQELYAGMAEEELQAVADDGYQLTDIARQALRAEISQRQLSIALKETPPPSDIADEPHGDFDPADLDLVTAFRVWDLAEARRVKEKLDAAYIPSYLGPDNIENVDLLPPITESGLPVKVRTGDAANARAAARDVLSSDDDNEEIPEYVGRCPKCHSEEIVFEGRGDLQPHAESADSDSAEEDPDVDCTEEEEEEETADVASEDDPGAKFNWRCEACGHAWQDDGIESDK
jgi:DNA-directed RNA polymerase subunit M/transcription elongation factor TFIIS